MLTRQQLYDIYYQGPEAAVQFMENLLDDIANQEQILGHRQQHRIDGLSRTIKKLKGQLERVKTRLAKQECLVYELTRRLQQASKAIAETHQASERQARDSHNSHLPPSSDLPAARIANAARRNRSLRRKSGKQVGGQVGHPGRTLRQVDRPDRILVHSPESCGHCAAPLSQSPVVNREKRQVFEIPPVKIEVLEHQAETRQCAACGEKTKARFPEAVKGPVQ